MAAAADLIDDVEKAEDMSPAIHHDSQLRWVTGRYIETDKANRNGHIFPMQDVKANLDTILHKPMNMLHDSYYIVGHYVDAQMKTPDPKDPKAGDAGLNPYVKSDAAFYAWYFPSAYAAVQGAYEDGKLFQSMECVPAALECPSCGLKADYAGRQSPTYCAHMNKVGGAKIIHDPTFAGGGLIIPPVSPAWPRADITNLQAWIEKHIEEIDAIHAQVETEMPHGDAQVWESIMAQLMAMANHN